MMPSNFHATEDDKYAKKPAAPAKVMPPPCTGPALDFDDKYAKAGDKHVPESLKKYQNAFGLFSFQKVPLPFFLFACYFIATPLAFTMVGGEFDVNNIERWGALQLEILGLIMLRMKIQEKGSVSGISGMTILMYTATYFCRIGLSFPTTLDNFEWKDLDWDFTCGPVSLLLVLDILRSVFVTYRKTYQEEMDVLKAWYLIPVCWTVSLLVRPHFAGWSFQFGYCWSSTLYMDVLALMPQVVMLSKAGGKVETPIANFVAATTISRCGDLFHSFAFLGGVRDREPFSYWMAVSIQIIHLLLVADFMYYYIKARASATKLADEIKLCDTGV